MVELRYSPFIFWIQIFLHLILVCFASSFWAYHGLTQKLNPQPPNMDPIQQNVMKVMPVVFYLFIIFPSALALIRLQMVLFLYFSKDYCIKDWVQSSLCQ